MKIESISLRTAMVDRYREKNLGEESIHNIDYVFLDERATTRIDDAMGAKDVDLLTVGCLVQNQMNIDLRSTICIQHNLHRNSLNTLRPIAVSHNFSLVLLFFQKL